MRLFYAYFQLCSASYVLHLNKSFRLGLHMGFQGGEAKKKKSKSTAFSILLK